MEGREPGGGSEERAEQAELLSLRIGGEEEATREESDLGGKETVYNQYVLLFPALLAATCGWRLSEPRPLSVNPCRGQCRSSMAPPPGGSYKQRLNSTGQAAGGPPLPPSGQRRHCGLTNHHNQEIVE